MKTSFSRRLRAVAGVAAGGAVLLSVAVAQPVQAQTPTPPAPPSFTTTQQCPKGQCIIDNYINPAIKALAAVVGVAVVLSIIVGGIQYTTSGDDPQKVSAAKQRIFKSLIALLAFFFLFRFLTWLIPGTPQ